jgi:hypothetical protein
MNTITRKILPLILLVFSYYFSIGQTRFYSSEKEYSVDFPKSYAQKSFEQNSGLKIQYAHSQTDSTFYRAETFRVTTPQIIDKEFVINTLKQYAHQEALSNPIYSYEKNSLGHKGKLLGYREMVYQGKAYVIKCQVEIYFGINSSMMIYAMYPSSFYSDEILNFFKSIKRY